MQKLVDGIHNFQNGVFGSQREYFQKLVAGQHPMALFITCSDSRIAPNLITQTDPGDLFIMRNAGNIVPPYGAAAAGGEAATIEFAVSVLKVPNVIVCGHSHCGALKALIGPAADLDDLPATRAWLGNAESTRRIVKDKYQHLDGHAKLTACVQENVLVQLEHLRTHPMVASGLAAGTLNLHGWVYKFETGEVFAFDPGVGQFVPIATVRQAGTDPAGAEDQIGVDSGEHRSAPSQATGGGSAGSVGITGIANNGRGSSRRLTVPVG